MYININGNKVYIFFGINDDSYYLWSVYYMEGIVKVFYILYSFFKFLWVKYFNIFSIWVRNIKFRVDI